MNRARLGLVASAAWVMVSSSAWAQSAAECAASNDKSQKQQQAGRLIQAQKELATCASEACPEEVRSACRKRSEEISAALPSVVLEVTDAAGQPVKDIEVTVDGRPLDPDETTVAVNPGAHKLVFTAPGKVSVERALTLAEGDKLHHEHVTLATAPQTQHPPSTPLVVPPPVLVQTKPARPRRPLLPQSNHGPFYVQLAVGALNYSYYSLISNLGSSYGWAGYRPDVEIGLHVTGRSDGLSIGLRQSFLLLAFGGSVFGSYAAGVTQVRVGYDFVVPLKHHEVDIDPYVTGGLAYTFDSLVGPLVYAPSGGFVAGGGVDIKAFLVKSIYAFARPIEFTMLCFVETAETPCGVALDFAAGAGITF